MGLAASETPDASTSRTALNTPQFVFIEPDGDRPSVEPACFISVPFCRPPAVALTAVAAAAAAVLSAASGPSGGPAVEQRTCIINARLNRSACSTARARVLATEWGTGGDQFFAPRPSHLVRVSIRWRVS